MLDFQRDPSKPEDREWLLKYVQQIYGNPRQVREGTFSGQGAQLPSGANARGPVWFFERNSDVVIVDKSHNFVTILKNGVDNASFKNAKVLPKRP